MADTVPEDVKKLAQKHADRVWDGEAMLDDEIERAIMADRSARPTGREEVGWRDAAVKLWKLLDDIDTLDDAWKEDDSGFRKSAYAKQRQRFSILSGEDYDNALAGLSSTPPSREADAASELRRLASQTVTDLTAAHAEIVKLQGGNPSTSTWPAWSSPAHTIAWCNRILQQTDVAWAERYTSQMTSDTDDIA